MQIPAGVHLIPVHMRNGDFEYIHNLQPSTVTIVNPDAEMLRRVAEAAPQAVHILRNHLVSEQKSAMYADPVGTGRRHARELMSWAAGICAGANVDRARCRLVGVNEPLEDTDEQVRAIVAYTITLLSEWTLAEWKGLAIDWSVGHPARLHNGKPSWVPYQPILAEITRGGHWLNLHQYFPHEGPAYEAQWYGFRHEHCAWDCNILIGEFGMDDGAIAGRQLGGWRKFVSPEVYVGQLRYSLLRFANDPRVVGVNIFTTDGAGWHEYDTEPIHNEMVKLVRELRAMPAPPSVQPKPPPPQPPQPDTNWDRAIAFVLDREGGYVNDPRDAGGETNWGITKRSYPDLDIRNLTREQAIDIYRRDYWQQSGAARLDWPLSLVHFDSAVQHGVGRAEVFLSRSGGNIWLYLAEREEFYAQIRDALWQPFGKAWMRRMAALKREIAR